MRVVFVGASRFGLRCLDGIRGMNVCEVAGVVTAPARFAISYRPEGMTNVLHADFPAYCAAASIPHVSLSDMKAPALLEAVRSLQPDAFIVAGWYHLIPRTWRELAPAYGLHASLLPDYSGGAPLVWAMINGERKTGITLFRLDDGVDSGPIVGQAETVICDADTIATLYARIEDLGTDLLIKSLPSLADGTAVLTDQDESRRRVFPQRSPGDGRIDWRRGARELYDFVRAQTRPYPGAFTNWRGEHLEVWSATVCERPPQAAQPGEILDDDGGCVVATGSGVLALKEVGVSGRTLSGAQFRDIVAAGDVLGEIA